MSLTIKFDIYPSIEFTPEAWERMWYLVDKVGGEVGWLGKVKRLNAYQFLIDEVLLPPQDANGTTTEMQAEDMPAWYMALQDARYPEIINELTMHMHSHANMGLGRSGQDLTQWEKWRKDLAKRGLPSIMGRANKKGEIECELYLPEFSLAIEGIVPTMQTVPDVRQPWQDELDALIKENVRTKSYATTHNCSKGGGGGAYPYEINQGWRNLTPEKAGKEDKQKGKLVGGAGNETEVEGARGLIAHHERTRIAAKYGLRHYNSLQTELERDQWRWLTGEIIDIENEGEMWDTKSSVAYDVANVLQDYPSLLTQTGEQFIINTTLKREVDDIDYGYDPMRVR